MELNDTTFIYNEIESFHQNRRPGLNKPDSSEKPSSPEAKGLERIAGLPINSITKPCFSKKPLIINDKYRPNLL